jgi:hypothetical protein
MCHYSQLLRECVICDVLVDSESKTSPFVYRGADHLEVVTLESDVPFKFDLLDTSNVSDSAGLLDILCVTHRSSTAF